MPNPSDKDGGRRIGGPNGVQAHAALFTAQRFKVGNFCRIAQVVAEHRDVNIFGKPRDQSERLGQRGAALNSRRGLPGARLSKSASKVQQTQKSFSTF